ncbi:DUF3265 domain-containing protein [Vibrio harveyi]|nr:DUF3265 domain-containing protein [Vibrio harveyi]
MTLHAWHFWFRLRSVFKVLKLSTVVAWLTP